MAEEGADSKKLSGEARPSLKDRIMGMEDHQDRTVKPRFEGNLPDINNKIRTSKYHGLPDWAVLSLGQQFRRFTNCYFLAMTLLSLCDFSPKMPWSFAFTFAVVLLVSMLKELYEDLGRKRQDQQENTRPCEAWKPGAGSKWQTPVVVDKESGKCDGGVEWQTLKVGDLVRIKADESVPADILVIATSSPQWTCYIDTAMLDGETSLKLKKSVNAVTETILDDSAPAKENDVPRVSDEKLSKLDVTFVIEQPHENMHSFNGSYELASGTPESKKGPANEDNIIYRGCTIRNTEWIVAVVVYVGPDTKIIKNMVKTKFKISFLYGQLNTAVKGLFTFLFCLCILYAILGSDWLSKRLDVDYLGARDPKHQWKNWFGQLLCNEEDLGIDGTCSHETQTAYVGEAFLTYLITFSHMIPMSLYVAMEILKLSLAYWVNIDKHMVHEGISAMARTSDLIEELGQVSFVFSDKTGTLTCNTMEFVRASVNGKVYGPRTTDELTAARKASGQSGPLDGLGGEMEAQAIMRNPAHPEYQKLREYMEALCVCHTCIPMKDKEGKDRYEGSSPDEVGLLEGCARCGVVVKSILSEKLTMELPGKDGQPEKLLYRVLHVFEFTSDRKRMSVIAETPNGDKWIFSKGADSIAREVLHSPIPDTIQGQIDAFAKDGLRTLFVAKKKIDPAFYDKWRPGWVQAELQIHNRKVEMEKMAALMEKQMDLVGVTGVEDRLQDGVPSALRTLKAANMSVWVLTGDKLETAIDIAFSAGLFTGDLEIMKIQGTTVQEVQDELDAVKQKPTEKGQERKKVGIAITGVALYLISANPGLEIELLQCALTCSAVVACRLAPKQKRDIVALVKRVHPDKVTLGIGDGANDVAMIQESHVGIGIRGKEGTQAVQASDYAISQFRFLERLLLIHGREGHRRVAVFTCYYFYKNIALCTPDVIWALFNGWSGQIFFPEWLTVMYNACFTSFPCIFVFSLDNDVPDEIAIKYPHLYEGGPRLYFFNNKVFWAWIIAAFWHGSVAWIMNIYSTAGGKSDGIVAGLWAASLNTFTCMILIVCMKLVVVGIRWSRLTIGVLLFSFLLYMIAALTFSAPLNLSWQPEINGMMMFLPTDAQSVLCLFATVLIAMAPDFIYCAVQRNIYPSPLDRHIFTHREKRRNQVST